MLLKMVVFPFMEHGSLPSIRETAGIGTPNITHTIEIDPMEKELVASAKAGDQEAFRSLMEQHTPKMRATIFSRSNGQINDFDIDDLSQEVFIKVYLALPRFTHNQPIAAWLNKITKNTVISYHRKSNKVTHVEIEDCHSDANKPESDPAVLVVTRSTVQEIISALAKLPEMQRKAVTCKFFRGLEYPEIAQRLGTSVPNTRVSVFRALAKLRQLLKDPESVA